MHCVYAGMEPLSFTNHFPHWEVSEEANTANTQENRPSTLEDMQACFSQLSKSLYTFEELQQRPLPDGVNPNKLEKYLSDEEFMVRMMLDDVKMFITQLIFLHHSCVYIIFYPCLATCDIFLALIYSSGIECMHKKCHPCYKLKFWLVLFFSTLLSAVYIVSLVKSFPNSTQNEKK